MSVNPIQKLIKDHQRAETAGKVAIGFFAGAAVLTVLAISAMAWHSFINGAEQPLLFNATQISASGLGIMAVVGAAATLIARGTKTYYNKKWSFKDFLTLLNNELTPTKLPTTKELMEKPKFNENCNQLLAKINDDEFRSLLKLVFKTKLSKWLANELAQFPERVLSNLMFIKPEHFEMIYSENEDQFDKAIEGKLEKLGNIGKQDIFTKYYRLTSAFGEPSSSWDPLLMQSQFMNLLSAQLAFTHELEPLFANFKVFLPEGVNNAALEEILTFQKDFNNHFSLLS